MKCAVTLIITRIDKLEPSYNILHILQNFNLPKACALSIKDWKQVYVALKQFAVLFCSLHFSAVSLAHVAENGKTIFRDKCNDALTMS